ncbi:Integrase [Sphingomonas sp. YR710]|uniref:tyrosine-type recombinase/integrase n=1 Tax=Sphingomonas sp. YR710 TaxID=1882773 RepID=UPI00088C1001|nr:integrase arm-type DNA-binding domain-containing protein [Sphingomonas sp. YR710]SDD01406.1 Integrase [Sphingomonas sp. YR710]
MTLTPVEIRAAKPGPIPYKLADEKGLFLLVQPSGTKLWRLKYRFHKVERKLSLGRYPEISLKEARDRRDEARRLIDEGQDPFAIRRREKLAGEIRAATTFRVVADEYLEKMEAEGRTEATMKKARWFRDLIDRDIGPLPVADITPQELLAALRKLERRGHRETASRVRSFASRVCRYAIVTGRATTNPGDMLKGALIAPRPKHHAALLDPRDVGELLRAIDGYSGQPETLLALQLAPHLYVRPGELRAAEWNEIDWEAAVWRIPAHKMKMKQPHAVPLSKQVVGYLKQLRGIGRNSIYLFPALGSPLRHMCENTLNSALRRLGYGREDMTSHGFRAMASTLLNESGLWHPDAIERSLAHGERNGVRAAYHRGAHWDERVRMAQWWSDHLDSLRATGKILRPKFRKESGEPRRGAEKKVGRAKSAVR